MKAQYGTDTTCAFSLPVEIWSRLGRSQEIGIYGEYTIAETWNGNKNAFSIHNVHIVEYARNKQPVPVALEGFIYNCTIILPQNVQLNFLQPGPRDAIITEFRHLFDMNFGGIVTYAYDL